MELAACAHAGRGFLFLVNGCLVLPEVKYYHLQQERFQVLRNSLFQYSSFFSFLCPNNSVLFNFANLGSSFVAIMDFLRPSDKVLYLSTNKLTHCISCLEKSVINKKLFKLRLSAPPLVFNFLLDFISELFFFKISFKGL